MPDPLFNVCRNRWKTLLASFLLSAIPLLGNTPFVVSPEGLQLSDHFGEALDVSGDTAVIGTRNDSEQGLGAGAVCIFQRVAPGLNEWVEIVRLTGDPGSNFDHFGESVAIDEDTVVVGVPGNDAVAESGGAVFVYDRNAGGENQWGLTARLTASDGGQNQGFGYAVDIDGDRIAATAWLELPIIENFGAAYVFERELGQWVEKSKLEPENRSPLDNYGISVAISGDTVVVGADEGDELVENPREIPGSAFVFERDSATGMWEFVKQLVPTDGSTFRRFGTVVGASGAIIAVGASGSSLSNGKDTGAVYIFERNTGGSGHWGQAGRLAPDELSKNAGFGVALRLKGNAMIAGAPSMQVDVFRSVGAVFAFELQAGGTWTQVARLDSEVLRSDRFFGEFVAIDRGTAIVGFYDRIIPTLGQQGEVPVVPLEKAFALFYSLPIGPPEDPPGSNKHEAVFGGGQDLGGRWHHSPWYGFYNVNFFEPWLFHADHEWTFVDVSSTSQSIFLYDVSSVGWFFTGQDFYPNLYSFNRTAWVFFFQGSSNPREFVDLGSSEFFSLD